MTNEEIRKCRLSLLLLNGESARAGPPRVGGTPLFFVGLPELNGKLGDDRPVVCLPLWPLVQFVISIEEIVDELTRQIRSIQDRGPYLLGGYCLGGFVAYEIARSMTSRGQDVALLTLVEASIVGREDRLIRFSRRLVFSMTCPTSLPRYFRPRIRRLLGREGEAESERRHETDLLLNCIANSFGDYWFRLFSGSQTYSGRVALFYGRRSVQRVFPTHGWDRMIRGAIDVRIVDGDHYSDLVRSTQFHSELRHCIDQALVQATRPAHTLH